MSGRSGLDAFPAQALEPEAASLYRLNFDAQLCVLLSIAVSQRRLADKMDPEGCEG